MRSSDWSSDVCSSDLGLQLRAQRWCRCNLRGAATRLRPRTTRNPRLCRCDRGRFSRIGPGPLRTVRRGDNEPAFRSEEHTSELQSLMRISYAVFCLKKKTRLYKTSNTTYKIKTLHVISLNNTQ